MNPCGMMKKEKTSTRTGGHMSQLQTKIIINGQDNASKAFKSAERSAAALREGVQELAGSLTRFFGLSATVGSFTVFGKASLDAALNLDRLNKAFSTIEGSSARGAARLDYLREVSDRLGQKRPKASLRRPRARNLRATRKESLRGSPRHQQLWA